MNLILPAQITLRDEQKRAISETYQYWHNHHGRNQKFLWNAKPRFGKTLTSYCFAQQIQAQRILIITNRPTISDSWAKDFFRYFATNTNYIFGTPKGGEININGKHQHIYSRNEIMHDAQLLNRPLIFFISLQDIKGKSANSNDFKQKNQWIFDLEKRWNLVIIDEGHEGIKTLRSDQVLSLLQADFFLYLSGTPFRALADQDFSREQIFTWTYLDEQAAKHAWQQKSDNSNNSNNPYAMMSQLNFLTYSLAQLFQHDVASDLYYDFAEFFKVTKGQFVHVDFVKKWLDRMAEIFTRQTLLPDSTELAITNHDMRHSLWLLSGAAECAAMQQLLSSHPYFSQFKVVVAIGKNSTLGSNHLEQVRTAIGSHPLQSKTITLSCGQLTTGVTIPAWSTIVMLYNVNNLDQVSATQYLQAAFRAQTPWRTKQHQKQHCLIFDFLPDRALIVLQKYAQNLCRQNYSAQTALNALLKYLNVFILENDQIQKLHAADIIELPSRIVAQEIVDGNFINSNKLFNVGNIFHMSKRAQQIISKLNSIHKHRLEKTPQPLPLPSIELDEYNQPLPNLEIIRNSYAETIKNKKFANLKTSEKQKISNLALILISKNAQLDQKTILKNCPKKNQELFCDAIREIQILAQKNARKHRRREENDYRDKLRGLARAIPILLHLYGRVNYTIDDLVANTPENIFLNFSGITKSEYQIIKQEGYFNEFNCNLAIKEFMKRKKHLVTYFLPTSTQNIFDFIPTQQNQYVFTPKKVATKMVNYLASQNPQIFQSPNTKFFDPAAKSGIILTQIVQKLYQNLRPKYRNDHDCLLHILTQQIYAWSPDSTSNLLVQHTLLDFMNHPEFHFTSSEIQLCRRNLLGYNPIITTGGIDVHAATQQIEQAWSCDMKFDVIISNPPYQYGRRQIYADFYRLAVDLDPELLCMIFPIGWQKTHNHNGLGQLNKEFYKRDPHLVSIDNYYETTEQRIFPDIGTGGVNIVLRDHNYQNHGQIRKLEYGQEAGTIVLPIDATEIIKPAELTTLIEQLKYLPKMDALGTARKPYGFYADPLRHPEKYNLTLSHQPQNETDVRLFGLVTSDDRGYRFIDRSALPKVSPNLDHYKLFVPKAWGNMSERIGLGGSYANICVAAPGDACTETFIEFGPFADQDETIKMAKYFMTKFFRALLFLAKDSQNTTKDKYKYIPVPDLSLDMWAGNISTLDQQLFDLYQIPPRTQDFICQNIQTRSELNIEIL